jgi:NAD(P)-dependent dehydrogenase (short-subunit alcohol dehydrogenase family)
VTQAGGQGIAVPVDHLKPEQVRSLIERIEQEQGWLDILVNDIGAEHFAEFDKPIWEVDLERGLRLLRLAIDTHLITSHFALPLLIQKPGGLVVELTDGTADYNNQHYRQALIYDLAKNAIIRMAWALAQELQPHGCTAVCLTPGWLRSEMMLDSFGVSETNWQDATAKEPHFIISETPRFVGRAVAHLAGDPEVARWHGPLNQLNDYPIRVCHLKKSFTPGFSLNWSRDRYTFRLQSCIFCVDIIDDKCNEQPICPMFSHVNGFEAFQSRFQKHQIKASIFSSKGYEAIG